MHKAYPWRPNSWNGSAVEDNPRPFLLEHSGNKNASIIAPQFGHTIQPREPPGGLTPLRQQTQRAAAPAIDTPLPRCASRIGWVSKSLASLFDIPRMTGASA